MLCGARIARHYIRDKVAAARATLTLLRHLRRRRAANTITAYRQVSHVGRRIAASISFPRYITNALPPPCRILGGMPAPSPATAVKR